MTRQRLKDYLYKDDDNYYYIRFHNLIVMKSYDLQEIQEVYNYLEEHDWKPSYAYKIREKNLRYKKRKLISKVFQIKRNNGNIYYQLWLKGLYVTSSKNREELEKIKQEYINSGCSDKYIDQVFQKRNKHKEKSPKYIHKKYNGKYSIYKDYTYYGTYDTLQEAITAREYCIQQDWDTTICKKTQRQKHNHPKYITKSRDGKWCIQKSHVHYGTFYSLQDAIEERDWLIKNNWNYDNIDLY